MTRHQVSDLPPSPTGGGPEKHDGGKYADLESVDVKTDRGFCGRNHMSVTGAGAPRADDDAHHADLSPPFCSNAQSELFHEPHEVSTAEGSASLQPHVGLRISENRLGETSDDYEVDDGISLVLSDDCIPRAAQDESHYITTHEIQLSELSDHEEDYDLGVGSSTSWDAEEDNRVYSFVDYASVEAGGAAGERGRGRPPRSRGDCLGATVSTLPESDVREAARLSSSDESASKPEQQRRSGTGGGQIHLSIRTTSRAINDPSNIHEQERIVYRARRPGGVSRYVLGGVDGTAETLRDTTECLVAAPARRLRGTRVPEYSSGTSSADDADQEVRTLTARAFRSLARPYFDAIHFSTSSESSASERARGVNRWSTFVDLKYGNMNMDQSLVSHQSSAASFQIAKRIDSRGYKGSAPTAEILPPHGASSSTKKIELMGKFGQGHSGVIRLTETLNFRCNVKSGIPAGESRTNVARSAAGSRSTDEVTDASPSRGAGGKPPPKAMGDAHKKAVFASSLITNVISKKMQFEQERKMERGEISEPQPTPSPSSVQHDGDDVRAKHKPSDSGADYTITCVNELGDVADTKGDSREQHAGLETKKGAVDSSRSTLHRSQNSAFRCWKDDELEFPTDLRSAQAPEETLAAEDAHGEARADSARSSKLKRMAHLFVPNIQMLPSEGEAAQQLQSGDVSTRGRGAKVGCVAATVPTSTPPDARVNLRRTKDTQTEPCAVSKLRAPNLGCNLIRTDHAKSHALAALRGEFSEKVPHFMVRDIRDGKGKLQTPIYQVRDVRKLVKSSYHFVSVDSGENKPHSACADPEQSKHAPSCNAASPIVIKCQSVNTSSSGKHCEREPRDVDRSSPEGAKRAAGGASAGPSRHASDSRASAKRPEKGCDVTDKKPEPTVPTQGALEKLQAAVKTMEQLYVFEKNEWKRRNAPRPLADSHVLSLIARQERPGHEGGDEPTGRNSQSNADEAPAGRKQDENDPLTPRPTCVGCGDAPKAAHEPSSSGASASKSSQTPQPSSAAAFRSRRVVSKTPKVPTSGETCERRPAGTEGARVKAADASECSADSQNYLAIPVKSQPGRGRQPVSADQASGSTASTQPHPPTPPGHVDRGLRGQDEIPSAALYHSLPLGMPPTQPQVYCFSPAITPAPTLDPFQATQRKMLLDPSTGSYYLVDTPLQPATKRLFDPETGQYVDVPMPQPPMTPVPVPVSPLALTSGIYGHTYMIYPGLMPTPSLVPARALLQSQLSVDGSGKSSSLHPDSPFYMSTGTSSQAASGAPQQAAANRPPPPPVISITSQQGPRIIAPPSFDGTTMSFMVEHR